jgi:outer membrane protein assembly factor BamB
MTEFTLLALDRHTGKTVWQRDRFRGQATGLWSTPAIRHTAKGDEVIVQGGIGVTAYDVKTGALRWRVGGLPAVSLSTPVMGDGLLFVTLTNPIGDLTENVVKLPSFDELLKKYDKNKDGKLSRNEIPADLVLFTRGRADKVGDFAAVRDIMGRFSKNKDGSLDRQGWNAMLAKMNTLIKPFHIAVAGIRLDGKGDLHKPQLIWQSSKLVPEVPSPLYYQGRLYLVNERGLVTCRDPKTGKEMYRERLGGRGMCYSSPVEGADKIYVGTEGGVVVVFKPGNRFKVLARNDIGERIMATPALVDNTIYLRTEQHLYAFAEQRSDAR